MNPIDFSDTRSIAVVAATAKLNKFNRDMLKYAKRRRAKNF
jgi:hypothetical protein